MKMPPRVDLHKGRLLKQVHVKKNVKTQVVSGADSSPQCMKGFASFLDLVKENRSRSVSPNDNAETTAEVSSCSEGNLDSSEKEPEPEKPDTSQDLLIALRLQSEWSIPIRPRRKRVRVERWAPPSFDRYQSSPTSRRKLCANTPQSAEPVQVEEHVQSKEPTTSEKSSTNTKMEKKSPAVAPKKPSLKKKRLKRRRSRKRKAKRGSGKKKFRTLAERRRAMKSNVKKSKKRTKRRGLFTI